VFKHLARSLLLKASMNALSVSDLASLIPIFRHTSVIGVPSSA
jgi:hypothetical protein